MNWDNLFMEKEMSGRVKVAYYKAPIMLRIALESPGAEPSRSFKGVVVYKGVDVGFAPDI
ncbi:hypothetical protein A2U01_0027629 [Trifolium medium]|uniref:Uncharacterized protein n=1 Tax=Trifolium medium TaxID=97028 RepID=A0A392P554_9FABA|nr:hypothetical protein [Trifolium medium]